jgi:TolB protein
MKASLLAALALPALISCSSTRPSYRSAWESRPADARLLRPAESPVLSNLRQLTFGGENAEGYFGFDERHFVFQRTLPEEGIACDQIFSYDIASGATKMISNGKGRTTCSYYLPGDSLVLYATTYRASADCPPVPDQSKGYVWPLYSGFDIVVADTNGREVRWLTNEPGYDAEATVSPTGDRIVFTSTRSGDIELYSMNLDGSDVRQLTNVPGYDGGAFFSWDGTKIVFRASRHSEKELESYRGLLAEGLVRPSRMELYVMNADGSGMRQITSNGAANFAPFWHPDGRHIIFASNVNDKKGRNFDLFLINEDGTGMRQLTFDESFDGFPMFTRDGRGLIFASNRFGAKPGETNLFLADFRLPEM